MLFRSSSLIASRFKAPSFPLTWVILVMMIAPFLILVAALGYVLGHFLYGTVGVLINMAVFYYCIGPSNPFYPSRLTADIKNNTEEAGEYLVKVNGQLFAVIFWYIALGPVGALTYRLGSLSEEVETTGRAARMFIDVLDWLPARVTALFYLLVGHFQNGFVPYLKLFFSKTEQNKQLLSDCGLAAIGHIAEPSTLLSDAEHLVEHSVMLLLVLLALFTLVAWI